MRRKLIKFLTLTLSLSTIFCLTFACNSSQGNANEHVHEYKSEIIEPTCSNGGYTEYSCACGDKYTADETDTVGHNFENYKCTVCGYEISASNGLHFELSEDSTYYILAGSGNCTSENIVIPFTYNNLPVKEIGKKAFYFPGTTSRKITSVVIPDSITKIGAQAFYCRELNFNVTE